MENTKKPPLKSLIIFIISAFVVFWIVIAWYEYTLNSGEELYLETAPVDPRDLLRWDYVTLRYAFESDDQVRNFITQNNIQEWSTLYISFEKDSENIWTVSNVSTTKPISWIFIKVQTKPQWWWRASLETWIWKYFVPQWTGRQIERIRWNMLIQLKVDSYGSAQIVDLYYEWKKIDPKTFKAQ